MKHETILKNLLKPLGVYDVNAMFNQAELCAVGKALDDLHAWLEEVEREINLVTAQAWGITEIEGLFSGKPYHASRGEMVRALSALLRIGGDSFTIGAINDALLCCGVRATVSETGAQGQVEIRFPGIAGIPDAIEQMRPMIEMIIPPHLEISYYFFYILWNQMEERFATWNQLERTEFDWKTLEKQVDKSTME